ncbi:MAG: hypothetical protein IJ141_01895 [Lachnospiraceae bacterium]|nr:hypothetical protein [Lachnospiraceae bacterium]
MRLKKYISATLCGVMLVTAASATGLTAGAKEMTDIEETDISVYSTDGVQTLYNYLYEHNYIADESSDINATITLNGENGFPAIEYYYSDDNLSVMLEYNADDNTVYLDANILENMGTDNFDNVGLWNGVCKGFDRTTYKSGDILLFEKTYSDNYSKDDEQTNVLINEAVKKAFPVWNELVKTAGVSGLNVVGFDSYEADSQSVPVKDTDKSDTSTDDITVGEFATYEGYTFTRDEDGDVTCTDSNDEAVIDDFKCDGTYTYYFQADGTAMKDRLTYHPDGEHVIYFDKYGHEVFSDFANVKKTIAGDAVDDYCFFDVYGYMYVDVLTYDKTGTFLYYANPYGVMEMGKWFQFSETVQWADGTEAEGIAGGYGYANEDGTLLTDKETTDWEGRPCYMQGNGVALY